MIIKTADKIELLEVDVLNGKFPLEYTQAIKQALEAMNGFKVDICIKKWRKNRSSKQNRYLQGAVYPAIDACVYQLTGERYKNNDVLADDVKTAIGWVEPQKVVDWCNLSKKFITVMRNVPRRSNSLNTMEFQEYCDKIRKWAYEFLKIDICDPEGRPWSI